MDIRSLTKTRTPTQFFEYLGRVLFRMSGAEDYEVLGPFGITSSYHIDLTCVDGKEFMTGVFELSGDRLYIRRTDLPRIREYPPGSIGDLNGMNYQREKFNNRVTAKDILDKMHMMEEDNV